MLWEGSSTEAEFLRAFPPLTFYLERPNTEELSHGTLRRQGLTTTLTDEELATAVTTGGAFGGSPASPPQGVGHVEMQGSQLAWEGYILETLGLGSHLGSSESGRVRGDSRGGEGRFLKYYIYIF